MSNCFLRMGTNTVENAKTVLDFTMLRLQQDETASSALFARLAPAAVHTTRPWAMLLVHDRTLMEQALAERGEIAPADRPWLEAMQICQVDTIHQLRALLCTLHISLETEKPSRSIISWMQHKKDGQPPCLIVVTDLLGLLLSDRDMNVPEVLLTHQTELAAVLALLVETCQHLNTTARQRWLSAFALEDSDLTTDLLITDDGKLSSETAHDRTIERILTYYIAQVM